MRTISKVAMAFGLTAALSATAFAQATAPPAPPSAETQLRECQTQNATVVQLWRDINNQRGGYEVQMASIRATLGPECPESQPVSQCVSALQSRYVDTASKLTKATTPAPAKPPAEKK